VVCWGANRHFEVGAAGWPLSPVTVTGLAAPVTAIAAGAFSTCALLATGRVQCWGEQNGSPGTSSHSAIPSDVPGLTRVTGLTTGAYHTCALLAGGGVKCWGNNDVGQLGDGTTTPHASPVDVSGLASGVVALAAGIDHTCAAIAGGGVKCWGVVLGS